MTITPHAARLNRPPAEIGESVDALADLVSVLVERIDDLEAWANKVTTWMSATSAAAEIVGPPPGVHCP